MRSKFIQIALEVLGDQSTIFTLDESGRVWWYDSDNFEWVPVAERRTGEEDEQDNTAEV